MVVVIEAEDLKKGVLPATLLHSCISAKSDATTTVRSASGERCSDDVVLCHFVLHFALDVVLVYNASELRGRSRFDDLEFPTLELETA